MSKTIEEIIAEKDSEIAVLAGDKARLDWLEAEGNRLHGWKVRWSATGPTSLELVQSPHANHTLRSAIDSARAGKS